MPKKNGTKTFVHYLSAAEAIVVKSGNNALEYYFPYTDHLGSIVAVTVVTGQVLAEQNFDAWGRKRNPANWTYDNIPAPTTVQTWLYRGYTGHEHLDAFGLINMNARLYDPILGRMLSPDNYAHGGSQGLNRYSYAHNNPLSYTDPDGNLPIIPIIAAVIGGGLNVYSNWDAIKERGFWSGVSYFGIGAIGGVASLMNPTAAAALVAGGNTIADVIDPNFQLPDNPLGGLMYFGKKALDGYGVAGSGQLAKGIASYFWKDSYRVFGSKVGSMSAGYELPTFEKINIKVPTSTVASVASKNLALGVRENLFTFAKNNGFTTYESWGLKSMYEFEKRFFQEAAKSESIHFNLTLKNGKMINVDKILKTKANVFDNTTNWELQQIFKDPALFAKTKFYYNNIITQPF